MCSSIYQNSQTKQNNPANRFNVRPDVTISPISGNNMERCSSQKLSNNCLENDKSIGMEELPTSSFSLQKPANLREEKHQEEPNSSGSEHTLIVEPDSSTGDYTDKKQNEQNSSQDTNPSTNQPFQDAIETEDFFGNNDDDEDDDIEDDEDDDLLESSDDDDSENFVKVKMERDSIDAKFMPNFSSLNLVLVFPFKLNYKNMTQFLLLLHFQDTSPWPFSTVQ